METLGYVLRQAYICEGCGGVKDREYTGFTVWTDRLTSDKLPTYKQPGNKSRQSTHPGITNQHHGHSTESRIEEDHSLGHQTNKLVHSREICSLCFTLCVVNFSPRPKLFTLFKTINRKSYICGYDKNY